MRPLFYIHKTSCISAQQSFGDTDLEILHDATDKKMLAIEPGYEGIPPGVLRRMGKAVRIGVGAALPIIKQVTEPINGFIIGTANGGMEDCIKFLNQIIQYEEGQLTPGNFVQSTPNAIAAQLGMIDKNRSYNITHVHRGLSFENALLDTALQLSAHPANTYLTGAVDEISAYNYNIEFLGDWYKDEEIAADALYNSDTKGGIAGEGAAMFLANNKKENAVATLQAIHFWHNEEVEEVAVHLQGFLEKHLPAGDKIDLLLSGENGDNRILKYYTACEALMPAETMIARFKHMTGEYTTSGAVAGWLACHILATQSIPKHMIKRGDAEGSLKHILIYNNYRGEQHSCMLLSIPA